MNTQASNILFCSPTAFAHYIVGKDAISNTAHLNGPLDRWLTRFVQKRINLRNETPCYYALLNKTNCYLLIFMFDKQKSI